MIILPRRRQIRIRNGVDCRNTLHSITTQRMTLGKITVYKTVYNVMSLVYPNQTCGKLARYADYIHILLRV